jgi:hypothetical protein
MKISPLVAAALVGLVLPASGMAQTTPRPDASTPARKSADTTTRSTTAQPMTPSSTATGERHSVQAEVTEVDADKGWVNLKTRDGRMKVHMPSGLEHVKKGDRVTLELGVTRGTATR